MGQSRSCVTLDRLEKQLCDIEYLSGLRRGSISLFRGQAVGEHDAAERASGRNRIVAVASCSGERSQRLLGAVLIDSSAEPLLHPHSGAAGVPNSELYYLGSPKNAAKNNSGVIDHIAFLATDPGGFVKHLKEKGVAARPRSLPESELFQIFIKDPDGLTIELNFFGVVKADPDWGGEDYSKMPRAEAPAKTKAQAKKVKASAKV